MTKEEVLKKLDEGGIVWAMKESVKLLRDAEKLGFVANDEESTELALISTATYFGLMESGTDKLAGILDDLIRLGYSYGYRAGKNDASIHKG